jgi:Hint domain
MIASHWRHGNRHHRVHWAPGIGAGAAGNENVQLDPEGKTRPDAERQASDAVDGALITGLSGLVAGTRVASNLGWRAVEALCVGDRVLTFDNGMRTIADIQRKSPCGPGIKVPVRHRPIFMPKDALSNGRDWRLTPEQGLLIESGSISDALGDPYAVVPAASLIGFRGIRQSSPETPLEMTVLSFFADEVVYADGGMLAFCPRPRCILTDDPAPGAGLYQGMDMAAAKSLVEGLMKQDRIRAFTYAPKEVACVA